VRNGHKDEYLLASRTYPSCCLVMIVTVLANLEGFVAPEHYLPVDNVGNRRQARLFTSAFELLWYGWIMWLAKVRVVSTISSSPKRIRLYPIFATPIACRTFPATSFFIL
jgi:hypothetical protein